MSGCFLQRRRLNKYKVALLLGILVFLKVQMYFIYKDSMAITKWLQIGHGSILSYFQVGKPVTNIDPVSLLNEFIHSEVSSKEPLNSSEIFEAFEFEYRFKLSQVHHMVHNLSGIVQTGPAVRTKTVTNGSWFPVKKVLWWTSSYGTIDRSSARACTTNKFQCVTTHKKKELLSSDAVIFHSRDLNALPQERLPNQRWIYYNNEPPMQSFINFRDYNGVFNWTATYMSDSDFKATYYLTELRDKPLSNTEHKELVSNIIVKKTSLVVARISNCEIYETQRLRFVRELQNYIPVDFYGACGDIHCPKGKRECEQLSRYKFYLSFENSNCRDYITEKARQPLDTWNAVPVVMGGSHPDEYANTLPPNSYIHVKGFSSVKRLAQYLIFLDKNSQFYEKYHLWRKTHLVKRRNLWCDICRALHNDSMPVKIYSDFGRWYEMNGCVNGCESIKLCIMSLFTVVGFVTVSNILHEIYTLIRLEL